MVSSVTNGTSGARESGQPEHDSWGAYVCDMIDEAGGSEQDMDDIIRAARDNGVGLNVIAKALEGGDSIEAIKADLQSIADEFSDAGASQQDVRYIIKLAQQDGVDTSVLLKALNGGDSVDTIISDLQDIAYQKKYGDDDSDFIG